MGIDEMKQKDGLPQRGIKEGNRQILIWEHSEMSMMRWEGKDSQASLTLPNNQSYHIYCPLIWLANYMFFILSNKPKLIIPKEWDWLHYSEHKNTSIAWPSYKGGINRLARFLSTLSLVSPSDHWVDREQTEDKTYSGNIDGLSVCTGGNCILGFCFTSSISPGQEL